MENLILFGTFAILLFLRVPIGVSLGMAVVAFLSYTGTQPLTYLASNMWTALDSFPLMAIPFFILAGALMEGGGLSRRLVNFGTACVGHVTGGFAVVTVLVSMFFGAISGSSPATVAAIGSIMIPAMIEHGYDKSFSVALMTVSGCLGVIVPPSIPMVLYGVSTSTSVGALFMGGFGPALVIGGLLITYAVLVSGGYFTPTEAAVIACVYGAFAGFVIYRELNFKKLIDALMNTSVTLGSTMIMVGTGTVLGRVLALQRLPDQLMASMTSMTDSKITILLLINLMLLVVGCIMDTTPAILILSPILYPIVRAYGVGDVHFGLIMVVNMAIGFITPPVGCNLFIASGMTNTKFTDLCKSIVPFIIIMFTALLIITYIPAVVEWLPSILGMLS